MKEYKFLKTARIIFKVLAWLGLIFSSVVGIMVLFAPANIPTAQGTVEMTIGMKMVAMVTYIIMGGVNFFIFYTISAIIGMLFDLKACCGKTTV
jgi:hypothetical protein